MAKLSQYLQKLNPAQRLAVDTLQGPVLVVAGPGTGKTQVLALRIANILEKTDVNASNILCLTFTESGAAAMRNRLLQIIGKEAYYVRIHTFHSFCNEIIQTFPEKFAFAKELVQLDDLGRMKIIREVIDALSAENTSESTRYQLTPFYNKYQYQDSIVNAIQTLKREGISPEKLKTFAQEELDELEAGKEINPRTKKPSSAWQEKVKDATRNLELAEIYACYDENLKAKGYYDYEDMILFVIEQFQADDTLLAYYQERYLYILVDEYQDTNGSQNEIIRLLGSFDEAPNIFAVGDDDQAIYRFQGANVENLLFFEKQFPTAKVIPITTSYRSSQLILDLAGSLIEYNQNRLVRLIPKLSKKLEAGLQVPKHPAKVYEFPIGQAETQFITAEVKKLVLGGVAAEDIAILYRKHSDAEEIAESLVKAQVPINLAAGINVLEEKVVQQLLNLLKVIEFAEKNRDFLLFEVLFYYFLGFDRLDVFKLTRYAGDNGESLFDLMLSEEKLKGIGVSEKAWAASEREKAVKRNVKNTKEPEGEFEEEASGGVKADETTKISGSFVRFAHKLVDWKTDSSNLSLVQFVEKVMTESDFTNYIFDQASGVNIEDVHAINSFYNYVRQQNRINKQLTLSQLLADIRLLEENNLPIVEATLDTEGKGVQLMTAHKAKGLEFKYVFLIRFYDGNWGGRRKREMIKLPKEIFDLTGDKIIGAPAAQPEAISLSKCSARKQKAPGKRVKSLPDPDLDLEDERRLAYVALTRAQEYITITYAQEYPSGNATRQVTPSQFLTELDPKLIERVDTSDLAASDPSILKQAFTFTPALSSTEAENQFLRQILEKFRLSASSLNEYLECPLKFKFNRLLKVPKAQNKAQALGTAIHHVMEHFYRQLLNGIEKDLDYMLFLYESALGRQLLGKVDFEETLAEGKKLLAGYYKNYKGTFKPPVAVEYGFYDRQVLLNTIPLTGKIDKLEWVDKEHFTVKVTDYKTMTPKSANDIKGETKHSEGHIWNQLVFYRLLGDLDDRFRPKTNSPKYKIEQVEIDFIKPNNRGLYKKETFEITNADVEKLKALVIDVMLHIRDLDFVGSEAYPMCGECEYCKMI